MAEKRVNLIAEAENLVPAVREDYRRAGQPEPPNGITGSFVLALALDVFEAIIEGRAIPVPADVFCRTAGLLNAVAEAERAGQLSFSGSVARPTAH